MLDRLSFQQPYAVLGSGPADLGQLIINTAVDNRHNLRPEWAKIIERWGGKMHGGRQARVAYLFLINLITIHLLVKAPTT